ncbi:SWI/SNF-related matrix-associated actin-dependent regulator of chromatin subfamily A-like protein 1 [Sarcoptes scabiei]|nr:SWI/SNF-related matrix-associated actin-dependent regulator of chromatin subfamily A-like protein 1 [Sarcoptes scabiei]
MKFKSQIKNTKNPNDKKSAAFSLFAKSAEAKVEAVNEYLIDILKNDFKIIVFCHHKSMMDGVEEILNKEKINHIRIDGNTSPKVRQEACEVFQTKDSFRVALLSITACATGLNLTAASMVVFAEVFWNPGVLAQVILKSLLLKIFSTSNCFTIFRLKIVSIGLVNRTMSELYILLPEELLMK